MESATVTPAPGWRRLLAGLTDAAIVAGVGWRWRGVAAGGAPLWLRVLGASSEPLREQLRSPGQRLLGVRTVDRRSGGRVALWRTLVLFAAGAGGELLQRRLTPAPTPEQERERERYLAELRAVYERHPHDAAAREPELSELQERHPQPIVANLGRAMAPTLAVGLVRRGLRRRLAPTTEIRMRSRRGHHSP